jgi:heat shock protein HtpX/STE24 endopeptidase
MVSGSSSEPVKPGTPPSVGRHLDAASLVGLISVVVLLPVGVVCFLPVALLLGAITRLPPPLVVIAWLAAAGLMFVPSVEQFLLRRLFDARPPTSEEQQVLDRCWQAVCQQASVAADRFLLAVEDTEELNAATTGGHIVIVTSQAIQTLPEEELRGVLAHELGHHLGLHAVGAVLAQWLSLPILWCSRLSYRMSRIAVWLTELFDDLGYGAAHNIGILIALEFRLFAFLLRVFTLAANALGRLIGQRAEYQADRTAAALGYAAELHGALRRLTALGLGDQPDTTAMQRLFSTHRSRPASPACSPT